MIGFENPFPPGGLRNSPTQVADGRRGVGDSFIDANFRAGAGDARELTAFGLDRFADPRG
jgi:hypothetical protein